VLARAECLIGRVAADVMMQVQWARWDVLIVDLCRPANTAMVQDALAQRPF